MIILFALSGILALLGAWLVVDFWLWYFTGKIVPGTIVKFEKDKPVLAFTSEQGVETNARADAITQFGYFLGKPQAGDVYNIIYRELANDFTIRVHGHLYLVSGAMLFVPLLGCVAYQYGQVLMASQLSFVVVFTVLVLGCWALMKLLRRNY